MSDVMSYGLKDLLELFQDSVSSADVLSAKLNAQISSAITNERIRLNMNQKDFASYLGVSQSLISRWECGDCNFSISKISDIACKLNMTVDINMIPLDKQNNYMFNDKDVFKEIAVKKDDILYNTAISAVAKIASYSLYNSNFKEANNYDAIC